MSVQEFDIGESVQCDWFCGGDYTGKSDGGGLLFMSKAVCPKCAPSAERGAKQHGEERYITARCPEGVSFAAWVLSLRGGDNKVRIYSGDDWEKGLLGEEKA